jgi:hypothetical protein
MAPDERKDAMSSYNRDEITKSGLPVTDMARILHPTANRGFKARFFLKVVERALAKRGIAATKDHVANKAKNAADSFNLFQGGRADTLRLTEDVELQDVQEAWDAFQRGEINLGSSGSGSGAANGNGAPGNGQPANTAPATPGGQVEDVQPVTPNVYQSAYRTFEKVRTDQVETPRTANDAYRLLWDDLAPEVRSGRVHGVLADAIGLLYTEDKTLVNALFLALPDSVRDAIEEALLDTAPERFYRSLRGTVESIYHIDRSPGRKAGYGGTYFSRWEDGVKEVVKFYGRNEPIGWEASDQQRKDASKDHAMAALRAVVEGLMAEVRAQMPAPTQPEQVQPIQINEVLVELSSKLPPEQLMPVIAGWAARTPEEQHAFLADLRKEESTEVVPVASETEAPATETQPEPEPQAETPAAEPETQTRGRGRNQPAS